MTNRAVCFDLGGVVARISYRWAEMLERCGIPIPADILPTDNIHSMPGFDEYQAGDLTDDQYFEQLGKYLGGISSEDAQRVHLSMLIEPFPGVLEIVHQLNAKAIVTGCLSNTNAPHWHDLAESGRFPAIQAMRIRMASHLIDAAKPDPRAFECFLDACGLPPAQVLLFDDSQANCVAAAELGWSAVRIDPEAGPARQIREALVTRNIL